jgi:hypothetical protein
MTYHRGCSKYHNPVLLSFMTYHRGCNKYHNPVLPSFMTYHRACNKYHNPVLPSLMTYHRGCNKYHNPVLHSFLTYHRGCNKYHNPVLPSFVTYHLLVTRITGRIAQEMSSLPERSFLARSLVFCLVFCRSFFALLSVCGCPLSWYLKSFLSRTNAI